MQINSLPAGGAVGAGELGVSPVTLYTKQSYAHKRCFTRHHIQDEMKMTSIIFWKQSVPSEIQWYKNTPLGFRFWNVQCSTKRCSPNIHTTQTKIQKVKKHNRTPLRKCNNGLFCGQHVLLCSAGNIILIGYNISITFNDFCLNILRYTKCTLENAIHTKMTWIHLFYDEHVFNFWIRSNFDRFCGLKTKLSSQRLKKSLIKRTELLKMINFCELKCI